MAGNGYTKAVKILVCLKQVPGKDAPLRLDPDARWIRGEGNYEINEPDAFALEEALRQKEAHGGEVVALSVGPARAAQALREALAKGADRAIHVEGDVEGLAPYAIAEAITRAIAGESFDLVLTGLQSDDGGYGQTGVIVAELWGAPHATIVMQIEPAGEKRVRVKRELEGGYFQYVEMPTPAVLTIQSGIHPLRYATLMGIKQAKNKPMVHTSLEEHGVSERLNRQTIERVFLPPRRQGGELLPGTSAQQAAALATRLRQLGLANGPTPRGHA